MRSMQLHTKLVLLLPLLKLGRIDEAMECQQKGYPLVATNQDFLLSVGEHLYFVLYAEDGSYNVSCLVNWFSEATRDLATRFDRRNSHYHYVDRLSELDRVPDRVNNN